MAKHLNMKRPNVSCDPFVNQTYAIIAVNKMSQRRWYHYRNKTWQSTFSLGCLTTNLELTKREYSCLTMDHPDRKMSVWCYTIRKSIATTDPEMDL